MSLLVLVVITWIALILSNTVRASIPDEFNPGASGYVRCFAVQADGNILIGGDFTNVAGRTVKQIARVTPDGTLDTSFFPTGANGFVAGMAIQPDGKIVVAGGFSFLGESRLRIGRLHSDGTLDITFNPQAGGSLPSVSALAVQSDGKILVGGEFTTLGGLSRMRIGRLHPNGAVETNFNPGASGFVRTLALQSDGKIIVGGGFTNLAGQVRRYMGRLHGDGSLDSGFDPAPGSNVVCLALQEDGKILVGGVFTNLAGANRFGIGRLNSDGSIDAEFDPGVTGQVWTISVLTDGRILIGGIFTVVGGQPRTNIALLNSDGSVDTSFNPGTDGLVFTTLVQSDGRILVGGDFASVAGENRSRIARLTSLGTPLSSVLLEDGSVTWMRSGPGPQIQRATVERWNGLSWTDAAEATRIAGGWQLNDPALLTTDTIRFRGHITTGGANASSWITDSGAGPIVISEHPSSRTNNAATYAQFSVAAIGTEPLAYQWRKDGVPLADGGQISGSATPVLSLAGVLGSDAADYTVVVSNVFGSVTSSVANLKVIDPLITSHPVSVYVSPGTNATLNVTVIGASPMSFQWRREGVPLEGVTNSICTITNVQLADAGRYDVVVSTPYGTATSQSALLAVNMVEPGFNPNGNGTEVTALALQPDGKILAAGSFVSLGGTNRQNIARLNPDGTADPTFNPGANGSVRALLVQPDGRIVAAGEFGSLGGQSRLRIGRLNGNGTIDASFNPGPNDTVLSLARQDDGSILVGGQFTSIGGQARSNVARLTAAGVVDAGFNPGANGAVRSIAVQPDGKLLIAGQFTRVDGANRTNLARLNADGTLDHTFLPPTFAPSILPVDCVALQADGRILISGQWSTLDGISDRRIARLEADGTFDTSFNPRASGSATAFAVQADGRIVIIGGFEQIDGQLRRYIARVNADGTPDTTFNCPMPNSSITFIRALALQPDGKVLLAGNFTSLGGVNRTFIGRLLNPTPAVQSLTLDSQTLTWSQGGSSPEAQRVDFDSWNGSTWTELGPATRITGGWERTGVALPPEATVRGRGFLSGGNQHRSGWPIEIQGGSLLISGQPASRTNNAGTTATFSVGVVGGAPVFQWLKDGIPLADGGKIFGAGASTLTLSNVLGADAGDYAVVVGNHFGSVTSAVARLTVNDPCIVKQPFDFSVGAGFWATFSVNATGTPPISYQWFKAGVALTNGGNVSDVSTPELSLNPVFGADRGLYSVVISNVFGAITSNVRTLIVIDPRVTASPAHRIAEVGGSALFEFEVVASSPLTIQWRHNGVPLSGKTNATLSLTNIQTSHAGNYDVVVSNEFGTAATSAALLTVNAAFADEFAPGPDGSIISLAIQPDGKIVAGGAFSSIAGYPRTSIARLFPDGTLDLDFNPAIKGSPTIGSVKSLAIQRDGRILVAGTFTNLAGHTRTNLGRLHPNGELDLTFDPAPNSSIEALALQADGRILVGGNFTWIAGRDQAGIARLNPDGSSDSNFIATISSSSRTVLSIAEQADGKLLLGGYFRQINGTNRDFIARLETDGSLDPSFNPGANSNIACLVVQSDGKILASGNFTLIGGVTRPLFARLHPTGGIDTGFNIPIAGILFTNIRTIALQSDGRILIGGFFTNIAGHTRHYLARLHADGSVDGTFNPGAFGGISSLSALALQGDGKILIGGLFTSLAGAARTNLARLDNTDPATERLGATADSLIWLREGTGPEIGRAEFEILEDDEWVWAGTGTRIPGGWALNGYVIQSNALVRTVGNASGGIQNASAWFVESSAVLYGPPRFSRWPAPAMSPAGFSARIENLSGAGPLILYTSTNLVHWTPALTNPPTSLQVDILDPDANQFPQRFYRAVEHR